MAELGQLPSSNRWLASKGRSAVVGKVEVGKFNSKQRFGEMRRQYYFCWGQGIRGSADYLHNLCATHLRIVGLG